MTRFQCFKGPSLLVQFLVKEEKVTRVTLQVHSRKGLEWEVSETSSPLKEKISNWMHLYASGQEPSFSLPLNWNGLSLFTTDVLKEMQSIPFGRKESYQSLAERINRPKAFRAVGSACGRNPFPLIIPCHRILAARHLGGYSLGLSIKEALLTFEGSLLNF